ncbi:MAG: 50S ribosomal protein L9 [candidate division Zixibacteria bacterium CG_4_9_14_3_um_filter_46_8]|nr:MAG: 50S ribosomal protein L9 [candidate division Zixibacteria bacterium CG_4_9_14_3_um_filter_46_8]
MKIILKDDVETLGKVGDIIVVKDGYARNFLIPKNLAIPATKGHLKSIDEIHRQKTIRDNKRKREVDKLKESLEKTSCTAEVLVGEEDRVFGSVTSYDIAEMLVKKGFKIDRHNILLDEPLRTLGVYAVPVRIDKDVNANLKVWVVKKGADQE